MVNMAVDSGLKYLAGDLYGSRDRLENFQMMEAGMSTDYEVIQLNARVMELEGKVNF